MPGLDAALKALSDPTRREILRLLQHGESTAGDLAARFSMTKPSMSHHFTVLKAADLIHTRRDGSQLFYSLNRATAQDVIKNLSELFGIISLKPPKKQR